MCVCVCVCVSERVCECASVSVCRGSKQFAHSLKTVYFILDRGLLTSLP